ncbi:Porphobilinogen deaminase [Frankliniella fusca]|uniref:hydroxymethylbilane synthase n=1 Tax=Frankliniella fusca TaxID=407009 RepID=A0AAE1HE35_9NEOP|nr:Porphobilinogen deaminase [Frankliniella fusca]
MTEPSVAPPADCHPNKIVVGSRNSKLALVQTHHVIQLMEQQYPEKKFDLISMSTTGDKILDIALPKIGEKSLFTKELETALEAKEVQFVVHSLKDLPTTLPDGFVIGAVLEREDPRDAVVMHKDFDDDDLSSLPPSSVIGTSSLRRKAQLLSKFSHLSVESIRGNLNTRLRKLDENKQYSAIILAMAGLNRMGWNDRISKVLPGSEMMYAVGQGALAVECAEEDAKTLQLLSPLHHRETALQVVAERSFLCSLGGGCSAPVGVVSELSSDGKILELEGGVWSLDGTKTLRKKLSSSLVLEVEEEPPRKKAIHLQPTVFCGIVSPTADLELYKAAFKLGQDLAEALISEGASSIMEEARKANESS